MTLNCSAKEKKRLSWQAFHKKYEMCEKEYIEINGMPKTATEKDALILKCTHQANQIDDIYSFE